MWILSLKNKRSHMMYCRLKDIWKEDIPSALAYWQCELHIILDVIYISIVEPRYFKCHL